jgi:hypothetical protein
MNWNKITVRQYQDLLPIITDENLTDLDKLVKVISLITGKSEDVIDSWPIDSLNEYKYLFEFDFKKEAKKRVKVNGRYYRFNWQVNKLKAARYIEAKTFVQGGLFQNLHKIMASCVIPERRIMGLYFDKKYNAADHDKYATDLLDAPFPFVYNACVFFCQLLMKWIDITLSYSEDIQGKITKSQMRALKESLQSITDGFIARPLSQIMKESA